MQRWPRRTVLMSLAGAAALVPCGATQVRGQSGTPEAGAPGAQQRAELLPRNVVLSLAEVQDVLPEIASETATGGNATAVGAPEATRAVTFATADGKQRLVLS